MRWLLAVRGAVAEHFLPLLVVLLAAVGVVILPSTTSAAITTTGNVDPADPSTWTTSTSGYVGNTAGGTLTADSGSAIVSGYGWIGYNSGVSGTAAVDGSGSQWADSGYLYIGSSGSGTLSITNGGVVSNTTGYLGYNSGSTGTAAVDGSGSQWTDGNLLIGYAGSGTLNVMRGGVVSSYSAYLGYNSGSTGTVTVDGSGSQWTNSGSLTVGYSGSGTLNIANGGAVSVTGPTYLGYNSGSSGTIAFGSGGGTLTTQCLYALPAQLTGTGTINTRTLASDLDLVFDSTASLKQAVTLNRQPGQKITVNLDLATNPSNNGALVAGWKGAGTISIRNGTTVNSQSGYVGYNAGSTGAATVDGSGSQWTDSGILYVGYSGSGTLSVTNGGVVDNTTCCLGYNSGSTGTATVDGTGSQWTNGNLLIGYAGSGTLNVMRGGVVSSFYSYVGCNSGATGTVTVDGSGSKWTNSGSLTVGYFGSGMLNVTGGGAVTATSLSINSKCLLAVDVGTNSTLVIGNGTGSIANSGTVRLLAGARPAARATFSPTSAGTWSGSGALQAVGGTWNASTHVFTVSDVQSRTAGTPVSIDLATKQRVLVSDAGTGWALGASFLAKNSSSVVNFTGSPIGGSVETALKGLLGTHESVLSGWTCSASGSGYAAGDPAYLSFLLGGGYSRNGLDVWHYDGTSWTAFNASDLTYDGSYASFTVTGFSAYAVTGMLILLGDANSDGVVDLSDLSVVLTNFDKTGMAWSQGDFDQNGTVDVSDLSKLLTNFDKTSGAAAAGVRAVPEPSGVILAAVAAMGWLVRSRRGRSVR